MKKIVFIVLFILLSLLLFINEESKKNNFLDQMKIYSSAFEDGGNIPARHTCDGGDHSLPVDITGTPAETRSFAIIFDDPDAATEWVHWIYWNIPADETIIYEDAKPNGIEGYNSWNTLGYRGPCPPEEHRYFLRVYALDTMLDLNNSASKSDLLRAMDSHLLDQAEIMGRYKRME